MVSFAQYYFLEKFISFGPHEGSYDHFASQIANTQIVVLILLSSQSANPHIVMINPQNF
jgi:hypothetical protein